MGNRVSSLVTFFARLIVTVSYPPAIDNGNTNYNQTVLKPALPDNKEITDRIAGKIQKNDHAARLFRHSSPRTLFIINHSILSSKQLETIFADIGILISIESPGNFKFGNKPLQQGSQIYPLTGIRTCGGTKEAWKNLLYKYFH